MRPGVETHATAMFPVAGLLVVGATLVAIAGGLPRLMR